MEEGKGDAALEDLDALDDSNDEEPKSLKLFEESVIMDKDKDG